MKAKKIISIIIVILVSFLFFYSILRFLGSLFFSEYEIVITNKNRTEINKMLGDFYEEPNKINRIRFKVLLGDGELKLYNYAHLEKKTVASESDKIMYYMCENGTSVTSIYLFEILIEIIILLYMKSVLDTKSE
ncbi:MAG: hypothetical protein ACI4VH_05305 [Clostridia bacterium]